MNNLNHPAAAPVLRRARGLLAAPPTAALNVPGSRRLPALLFLAVAAFLTWSDWLRPPLSSDLRGPVLPLGVWPHANGTDAAGLLLALALAGNTAAAFNHPLLVRALDLEVEPRQQMARALAAVTEGADLIRTRLVGLTAAALFALSPVVIAVSSFGRYFAPLQFFTLLTVWCHWHAIRGDRLLNHRALWLTAVSFVAVFLSWEGGGLIAPGLILATLVLRRGKLATLFRDPQLWLALLAVVLVIGLQFSHRTLQQTQSLWFGISASDADMRPLWRYTVFQPWYYLFESSWNQDAFVPLLLLAGSCLLALTHPWRRPLRFLLAFHLTTCLVTSALLTIIAWRYIHHLTPVFILLAAAALVAGTHGLIAGARSLARTRLEALQARLIGVGALVVVLAAGSGLTLQLARMGRFRVQGYGIEPFKYIDIGSANLFLKEHVREGDVVLAHQPFTTNFFLGRRRADYWLQTNLHMPETLHEELPLSVDRRDGTPTLGSLRALEDLFARERRIWYVVAPSGNASANRSEVSAFLREHMDVVYEDYKTLVLFRDATLRPAALRAANQRALRTASIDFLP